MVDGSSVRSVDVLVPFDGELIGATERQPGEIVDHGGVELGDGADRSLGSGRVERGDEPSVHTGGVVAIGGHAHGRDDTVRQFGDEFLGRGLRNHDDRITVDGRIAVEEPTEVLDVADTNGAAVELLDVEDPGIQQTATQRQIGDAFGVVDDSVIEVGEHFGVRLKTISPVNVCSRASFSVIQTGCDPSTASAAVSVASAVIPVLCFMSGNLHLR